MRAVPPALSVTGSMTWEITWARILGFALSAVIQAVVRRSTVARAGGLPMLRMMGGTPEAD